MIAKDFNDKVLDYDQDVNILDNDKIGEVVEFLEDNLVTVRINGTHQFVDIKANRLEII